MKNFNWNKILKNSDHFLLVSDFHLALLEYSFVNWFGLSCLMIRFWWKAWVRWADFVLFTRVIGNAVAGFLVIFVKTRILLRPFIMVNLWMRNRTIFLRIFSLLEIVIMYFIVHKISSRKFLRSLSDWGILNLSYPHYFLLFFIWWMISVKAGSIGIEAYVFFILVLFFNRVNLSALVKIMLF